MNQKLLNVGVISLVLMVLFITGLILVLNEMRARPGSIGGREPLPEFNYCNSKLIRPCLLAANSKPNGTAVISVLVNPHLRNFYIKVGDEENEYIYTCEKGERKSIYAFCTGKTMPVGKTLSFFVVSTTNKGDTLVASGSFPIIGLSLATPEIVTPTVAPTFIPAFDHPPR